MLLGHHTRPKIFQPLTLFNGELPALSLMTTPGTGSVSAMVADLNWQSLEEPRIINDLTMFYKINFNVVNISFPAEINLGFQETRRSHDYKFMSLSSSVNAYKYSVLPQNNSGLKRSAFFGDTCVIC